jgi:hypothetical protein
MSANANEEFLALAKKADHAAMVAQGSNAKQYWQKIAKEYRALAIERSNPDQPEEAASPNAISGSVRIAPSLTGLDHRTGPSWYRLFLKSRTGETVGRSDYQAPDEKGSAVIAAAVFDACSDIAFGYELWNGDALVLSSNRLGVPDKLTELEAYQQEIIVNSAIALHESAWIVGESRKLLEEIVRMGGISLGKPV